VLGYQEVVCSFGEETMSTDAVVTNIGTSAGAVWETLAGNGPVALDWLCQAVKLPENDTNRGIGWLAREGKLSIGQDMKGHEWFKLNGA
jgi:hypothetical protein